MSKKLILPAELKVCATCSYWAGVRKVDPEMAVVVVDEDCAGECLVRCQNRRGLDSEPIRNKDCLWEHLAPDRPDETENPVILKRKPA